jgi:hypothetical protein
MSASSLLVVLNARVQNKAKVRFPIRTYGPESMTLYILIPVAVVLVPPPMGSAGGTIQ